MDGASGAFAALLIVFLLVIAVAKVIRTIHRWDRDSAAAAVLGEGLEPLLPVEFMEGSAADPAAAPVYAGLRLGEVSRHVDSNTSATITGWLIHDLGFHGWGAGVGAGRLELGVGTLGLSGTSQVNLSSSGTTRDNLMSDGFAAVLEQDTPAGTDSVRIVVPSEQAARELVSAHLDDAAAAFMKSDTNGVTAVDYPVTHSTLRRLMPVLLAFPDEASYISDRLHAVIRMSEESRPLINVWGAPLSQHAILGSAIQIGAEGSIQRLFSVELLQTIRAVTERAVLASKTGTLPPGTTMS